MAYPPPPPQQTGVYPPTPGQPPAPGYYNGKPTEPGGYGVPPTAQGYPGLTVQPPAQFGGYGQPHDVQPPAPGPAAVGFAWGMAAMSITPKTHGTVKAHSPFHAEEDAKILRKAMKGLVDEEAIINIIAFRTYKQRQEIVTLFKLMYGKDLIKELKSDLNSYFETLVVALMMKPRDYDVYCLRKAMSGLGARESVLIEILTSRTNKEIQEIKKIYKSQLCRSLEKDLVSETNGHFKRLLVSLCNASRNESPQVDHPKARQDAEALYSAGEKKWGTDESTFNMIMCSRSMPQLRATFDEYTKVAGRDIYKSIQSELAGDIEDGMLAVVEVARYPPGYFATRIYKSTKGAGTDDSTLIRCVVSRSEVDMVEVKQEFQRRYHKTLSSCIQAKTTGHYNRLLMAVVGN